SCGLFILLTRLDEETDLRAVALHALGMGVLFTSYDLWPYFTGGAVILLARRRRWRAIPVAVPCMLLAPAIVLFLVLQVLRVPWSTSNTDHYAYTRRPYLPPPALGVWLKGVATFPVVLAKVFLFSNMVFLPLLFLFLLLFVRARLSAVEGAL